MPARSRRYTRRAPPECPRPRAIQVLYWHTQYNMRGKRMQAVFPIYLLNSTVSFLSVISCVRRGRLFHRAGGEAIRFTARAAVSSAGARLRGPPNGTRAGPVAAVPPAAAGLVRRTRRDAYLPVTAPYIYRRAKRPKSCTRFAFFPKNFFVPLWMRTKFFASRWDGDRNGEKRAAARWGNRSVVPQGMGIKMGRKRAARPPGRLGRNGRSARRVAGGLVKTERKRAVGNGQNGARGPRAAKRAARERRAMENAPQSGAGADGAAWDGSAGLRPAGRAKARKSAGSLRRFWVGSFAPAPCRSAP